MKVETTENAALLAAYKIVADKARHLAGTGTFAVSATTSWEDHRQDAALAIAKKKGKPKGYLTITGLRAMNYSHAAALRERYMQLQRPQSDSPDDADGRESLPSEPACPGSWTHWRRACATLEEAAPHLSWQTIQTLAALLASDMDFIAAAKRLNTSRATIYRLFQIAAKEFRNKCPFRY